MKAVSLGRQRGAQADPKSGAGFGVDSGRAEGAAHTRRHAGRLAGLSVKATLRLAFALLLAGTMAIGVFSLTQISRLNGSTRSIYDQGHVASRAAEEARGDVLRASRAQKMLLTATTAKERDALSALCELHCAGEPGEPGADDMGDAGHVASGPFQSNRSPSVCGPGGPRSNGAAMDREPPGSHCGTEVR